MKQILSLTKPLKAGVHDYDDLLDDMSPEAYENRFNKSKEFYERSVNLMPTLSEPADIINIEVLQYELLTYIENYYLQG